MAPVLRSETNGQVPKMVGCPGLIALTYTIPAKHSATAWTIAPAIGAGAVAPAWPALRSKIGIPPSIHFSITWQLSVANFIGGTTKQFELETNGRSRHLFSPPAIICNISNASSTKPGSVKEVPTCFCVPVVHA